ncbi:MAG: DUF2804 domain-containing protein [Propionibacteriaceae bacterium]|jgi:hypothetical protein|nr:DUF2804 domain-containing protein [Propionibacteriaceae bacterium]
MIQREITTLVPLLGKHGNILYPGWARKMFWVYNRDAVAGRPLALKEWDYYQLTVGRHVLQMVIGQVSYVAQFAATLIDTVSGEVREFAKMEPLPLRRLKMPTNPDRPSEILISRRDYEMAYDVTDKERHLTLDAHDGEVDIDLVLPRRGDDEMVIATPFDKPTQFYLNCKAVFFGVTGHIHFGDLRFELEPSGDHTAIMDWGRGVWPLHQEWFWGMGAAMIGQDRFGFNIGWGFGDLRLASENMFFFNGVAHKLGQLQVDRDVEDYLAPWRFSTEDGAFDLTMTPTYDYYTTVDVAVLRKSIHQVHGLFSGHVRLSDGREVQIRDVFAFCEHAVNTW